MAHAVVTTRSDGTANLDVARVPVAHRLDTKILKNIRGFRHPPFLGTKGCRISEAANRQCHASCSCLPRPEQPRAEHGPGEWCVPRSSSQDAVAWEVVPAPGLTIRVRNKSVLTES